MMENESEMELLPEQVTSEDEVQLDQMPEMFQYYEIVIDGDNKNELSNDGICLNYVVDADEEVAVKPDEIESGSDEQYINVSKLEPITLPDGTVAYLATNGPETVKSSEIDDGTVFLSSLDQEELPNDTDADKEIPITLPDGSIAYLTSSESLGAQETQELQGNVEFLNNIEDDVGDPPSFSVNEIEVTLDNDQSSQVRLVDGSLAVVELKSLRQILNKPEEEAETDVEPPQPETETTEPSPNEKRKKEKLFPCTYPECGKIYTTMYHLKVHERTHTGDRPFKCKADGCDKAFMTTYSYKIHMRTHTGEKPFECEVCMKSFYTSGDLQKHIRIHTGERPFVCPICNYAFSTSNIRKVHIRTHTGERPYACTHPTCDKTFVSKTNFQNHLRVHTGERPYPCNYPGCGKRFTEYSSYRKHQLVHRNNNQKECGKCGAFYWQRSVLRKHIKGCNGVNPMKNCMPMAVDPMATLNTLTAKMSPTMTLTSSIDIDMDCDIDVEVDVDDPPILLSSQSDELDDSLELETEEELGDVFYITKHGNILPTVHLLDD